MNKLCEEPKSTKLELNMMVLFNLCHFLDSVMKGGFRCSKLFEDVVDFAKPSEPLLKHLHPFKRECFAFWCQSFEALVVTVLSGVAGTYCY